MRDLDNRLEEKLDDILNDAFAFGTDHSISKAEAIPNIKQAFTDAGWLISYAPQYREVNIAYDLNGEPYPAMRRNVTPELEGKWNESDILMRWPPEFLEIVGKHSVHWNHPKGETLLLIDEWLHDNYLSKEEWYDKFNQEFDWSSNFTKDDDDERCYPDYYIEEVAKKASGIKESKNA